MKNMKALSMCLIAFLLTGNLGFAQTYQTVKITAEKLNVREDRTLESSILGKLDYETLVTTSDLTDGWYTTHYLGKTAYISADYTQVVENFSTGYVTGRDVNLRGTPSIQDGTILTQLTNTEIKIYEKQDDWYKITNQDGLEGYVYADYVSFENTPDSAETPSAPESTPADYGDAANLIALAKTKLGSPYVWGGEGPSSFDCSGYVKYCFKETYGIELPHSASSMSQLGTTVSKQNLQPGDLVFFSTNGTGNVNHVGIYIGNGEFIQASSSDSNGHQVHINPINTGYYNRVYKWAQRISVE